MRLVAIGTAELAGLAGALAELPLRDGTVWTAMCEDATVGAVVAIRTEASIADSVLVIDALKRHGLDPRPFRVQELIPPDKYAGWSRRALRAANRQLPSGNQA